MGLGYRQMVQHWSQSFSRVVDKVTARPGSIRTDCERGEGEGRGFSGRRDKGTMYENLEVIIVGIKDCRLTEKLCILSMRVPSN